MEATTRNEKPLYPRPVLLLPSRRMLYTRWYVLLPLDPLLSFTPSPPPNTSTCTPYPLFSTKPTNTPSPPPGWVVEFLLRTRHGDLHKIGYVPSGFYGGLFLSRLILVEPTHRYGERRMLLLYSVLALGTQLVFWLVKDLATTVVMFSLMGFLMGPFFAAVSCFVFFFCLCFSRSLSYQFSLFLYRWMVSQGSKGRGSYYRYTTLTPTPFPFPTGRIRNLQTLPPTPPSHSTRSVPPFPPILPPPLLPPQPQLHLLQLTQPNRPDIRNRPSRRRHLPLPHRPHRRTRRRPGTAADRGRLDCCDGCYVGFCAEGYGCA